jgi:hypothetical protein
MLGLMVPMKATTFHSEATSAAVAKVAHELDGVVKYCIKEGEK